MMETISSNSLSGLDWIAVGLFLFVVIGIAAWVKFGQKGREDFFLAGRSMGWFVVMFSTFATLFSTVSFVSAPGESYKNGLMTLLINPALLLGYPLAIAIFLRFYLSMGTFTIYEYLEKRYNATLRFYGSFVFTFGRFIYGGTVFFAASKLFHALTGWDERWVIIGVGLFTIVYCATGGMKAVMITDVLQGIILIVGIFAVLLIMLNLLDFDLPAIYSYASSNGHGFDRLFQPEFYRLDLHNRLSFWVLLWMAIYNPIMMVSSDQTLIQRLMAARNYKTALTGIYGNLLLAFPVIAMLYLIGAGLFYYYGNGMGELPEGIRADYVMGHFVSTVLPSPLPGIIVAGMLAALMSTIDSNVNTISNVVYNDWLLRLKLVKEGSKYEMPICRTLTAVAGLICVALALLLIRAEKGTTTTVFEVIAIGGVVAGGPIFVAFTLGILTKRVSGKAMLVSLMIGWVLNIILPYTIYYNVPEADRISFLWVSFPGIMTTFILALLLSRIWPNTKNVDGLTRRDLKII